VLAVSCVLGVAVSYFAFLCRAQVSATHFTVIGNVCKVVTVLINVLIWDKHASPTGLGCLSLCLLAGFVYEPSPKRPAVVDPEAEQLVQQEEPASPTKAQVAPEVDEEPAAEGAALQPAKSGARS